MEIALVEFIEDYQSNPFEQGIALQPPCEDSLSDHLDAGAGRHPAVKTDGIANRFSDLFAPLLRHEACRIGCGQSARLQHQDAFSGKPGLIQQRGRHPGGLARSRRRLQHGTAL